MLINLYEKSNVFSFAYLFAVLYFWFKEVRFQLIKDINKAAIIILVLQYFFVLLDVNQQTSPLPLPNNQNLSLFDRFLPEEWINYLLIGFTGGFSGDFITSFLVSSIIIFLTEFYFSLFMWVSKKVVMYID